MQIDPVLPDWIHSLRVEGIEIAGESIDVEMDRGHVTVRGQGHLVVRRDPTAIRNAGVSLGDR